MKDIQDYLQNLINDSAHEYPDDIRAARKRALRIGERVILEQIKENKIRKEVMSAYLAIMNEKLPIPKNGNTSSTNTQTPGKRF